MKSQAKRFYDATRVASRLTYEIGKIIKKKGVEATFKKMTDDDQFDSFVSDIYLCLPDDIKSKVSISDLSLELRSQRDKKLKTKNGIKHLSKIKSWYFHQNNNNK